MEHGIVKAGQETVGYTLREAAKDEKEWAKLLDTLKGSDKLGLGLKQQKIAVSELSSESAHIVKSMWGVSLKNEREIKRAKNYCFWIPIFIASAN
jgi:hypothetical protein